jgi:AraC-like DNA-binding protein
MSGLVRYMPSIPLGEFVDYLYVDRSTDAHLSLNAYAQPTHPIVTIHATTPDQLLPGTVKGVFTQALQQKPGSAPAPFIGIRLKPYGMYTGFGVEGEAAANRILPFAVLFPGIDLERAAELLRAGDDLSAVETVHNVLYEKLEPKPLLYEITEMVDALVETDLSNNSQRYLAEAFERSPQSFIGVFRKAVGITPLHYLHIHKIEAAKRLIREQPSLALTDVAYTLGFYDQSHFIRVFKSHAGCTPFQYRSGLNSDRINSVQF